MKKSFIFWIVLSVLLVIQMNLWGVQQDQRITIPEGKVSVIIPEGWQRGVPSEGYSLLLGKVEPDTNFRANMSLMISNIPGLSTQPFTLDQLFASVKGNLDKSFQSGYGNLTRSTMSVLDEEILTTKYDIYREGADMTCKQYYIFDGDTRYLFTGVASQKNFSNYEKDFDAIVQSVIITP
jgi:hypothetical protein